MHFWMIRSSVAERNLKDECAALIFRAVFDLLLSHIYYVRCEVRGPGVSLLATPLGYSDKGNPAARRVRKATGLFLLEGGGRAAGGAGEVCTNRRASVFIAGHRIICTPHLTVRYRGRFRCS